MDIVVKGRNVGVPDSYRRHVSEKLSKLERYDDKIIRVDVELFHERNRRQAGRSQRVEITCMSRGPVVRAESCAGDFYAALDLAETKLEERLRRIADRRRVHHGQHAPVSVAAATSPLATEDLVADDLVAASIIAPSGAARSSTAGSGPAGSDLAGRDLTGPEMAGGTAPAAGRGGLWQEDRQDADRPDADFDDGDQPWHIVRMKEHPKTPMTVDDALFQMELVGHDFFLFMDKDSGRPSVVYRRRAYDYGVISLVA